MRRILGLLLSVIMVFSVFVPVSALEIYGVRADRDGVMLYDGRGELKADESFKLYIDTSGDTKYVYTNNNGKKGALIAENHHVGKSDERITMGTIVPIGSSIAGPREFNLIAEDEKGNLFNFTGGDSFYCYEYDDSPCEVLSVTTNNDTYYMNNGTSGFREDEKIYFTIETTINTGEFACTSDGKNWQTNMSLHCKERGGCTIKNGKKIWTVYFVSISEDEKTFSFQALDANGNRAGDVKSVKFTVLDRDKIEEEIQQDSGEGESMGAYEGATKGDDKDATGTEDGVEGGADGKSDIISSNENSDGKADVSVENEGEDGENEEFSDVPAPDDILDILNNSEIHGSFHTPSYNFLKFITENAKPEHCLTNSGEVIAPEKAKELERVAKRITAGLKTDREKTYAVYNYVIDTISYYNVVPNNEFSRIMQAYDTYSQKMGVCEDYTVLLNVLLRYAGIPALQIRLGTPRHALTAAYFDNSWHFMDATFGDAYKCDGTCTGHSKSRCKTVRDAQFDMSMQSFFSMYKTVSSVWEFFIDGLGYNFTYAENGVDDIVCLSYLGLDSAKTVTMQGEVYGVKVTYPQYGGYRDMLSLEKVIATDGVTYIVDNAFSNTPTLKEVVLSKSVKEIQRSAFENCENLSKITFEEGLETVGSNAFANTGIKKLELPSTVKTIGACAFKDCKNLKEVVINEGAETIEKGAFIDNKALLKLHLPSTIKDIQERSFYRCDNLRDLYYNGTEAEFRAIDKIQNLAFWYEFMGETTDGKQALATDRIHMNVHYLKEEKTLPYNTGQNNHVQDNVEPPKKQNIKEKMEMPNGPKTMENFKKNVSISLKDFTDLDENAWYADEVKAVIEAGIMMGKGDGIFAPDDAISGAEIVKMFSITNYIYNGGNGADVFTSDKAWYFPYWEYIYANFKKVITKMYQIVVYQDLEKPATREMMAALYALALPAEELPQIRDISYIPDYKSDENAYNEVVSLYRAGVMVGSDEKGSLLPKTNITRAEAAVIIARLIFPEFRIK